eukprot:2789154-Amphidinium_carterae.6
MVLRTLGVRDETPITLARRSALPGPRAAPLLLRLIVNDLHHSLIGGAPKLPCLAAIFLSIGCTAT